jgi:prepilin-type N-terminal cleavage/methylation domain-containing protein
MPKLPTIQRRTERGFTLIELLIVVVIIGILVAIAVPKFSNSKERAIVSQMRSDLRNMVTAQEAYISDALTYYNGPVPAAALSYDPSGTNVVTLSSVSTTGWAAVATNAATGRRCAIFVGTGVPPAPATVDGIAACTN